MKIKKSHWMRCVQTFGLYSIYIIFYFFSIVSWRSEKKWEGVVLQPGQFRTASCCPCPCCPQPSWGLGCGLHLRRWLKLLPLPRTPALWTSVQGWHRPSGQGGFQGCVWRRRSRSITICVLVSLKILFCHSCLHQRWSFYIYKIYERTKLCWVIKQQCPSWSND